MKKILILLLLGQVTANAQLLECSVGGGPTIHNIRWGYFSPGISRVGYNLHVSATTHVIKGIRIGLAGSYVQMPYHEGWPGYNSQYSNSFYIDPVLLELVALKRFKLKRFDFDLGIIGGICLNKRQVTKYIPGDSRTTDHSPKMWYTYGFTGSLQYNISKSFAMGINVHPAFIDMRLRENFFTMPLAMKATIKI